VARGQNLITKGLAASVLIALVLSACAGSVAAPVPTVDTGAIQATVMVQLVATMTAQAPTATAVPSPTPTSTDIETPAPSDTPPPTPTATIMPSPTGTPTPVVLTPESITPPTAYTVQSGDSLSAIAAELGVTAAALAAYNQIVDPGAIQTGQVLLVPPAGYVPPSTTSVLSVAAPNSTPAPQPSLAATVASVVEASVVISEYGGRGSPEFIAITNQGSAPADMTGWWLESVVKGNEDQVFRFPSGFILTAGATIKVYSGKGALADPPDGLLWTTENMWNNDGDTANLYDGSGALVASR